MKQRQNKRVRTSGVLRALVLLFALVASLIVDLPAAAAAPVPLNAIAHTGSGKVIDVLAVGDSYMAGNAAGLYYNVSPDDPRTPPAPYSGPGCYRSHANASYQAYRVLGSKGRYINRACSGKLTKDVVPEVQDLFGSNLARSIDLITYSAGGNDANFEDIVKHCFIDIYVQGDDPYIAPSGDSISRICFDRLQAASDVMPSTMVEQESGLRRLLAEFPQARIVVDGYPLLATKPSATMLPQTWRSWTYAASILPGLQRTFADQQRALVKKLNTEFPNRLAFNDLFARFGPDGRHAMGSADPWINRPLDLNVTAEGAHPTGRGQTEIATGIVQLATPWFSLSPIVTRASPTYYAIPGNGDATADSRGAAVSIASPAIGPCKNTTITVRGWVGADTELVTVIDNGPDEVKVTCLYPRAGDIVSYGTTSYLAAANATANPFPGTVLRPIPTGWMYNCLAAKAGVRKLRINASNNTLAGWNPVLPGQTGCVPAGWKNRVLTAPDNASWLVDSTGYRHWIPNPETFFALTGKYGPAIVVSAQVDVDTIPRGSDQPPLLEPKGLDGTIIRRDDGVSWVVLDGVRHHLPTYAIDLCAQYAQGRRVSRTGLSVSLASTLPEGTAYACGMESSILRANDASGQRPSYAWYGGQRHWIADTWTFDYLTRRGWRVIDVATNAEIVRLTAGVNEPKKLDPAAVPRNTIVRRDDGVSWVVDGSGIRHHIPYAQDDVCWRDLRGYGVSATGLSGGQVAALPEADRWPCIIGDRIVTSDDGSSWFVDTANSRHWVPDVETFWVLAKSYERVGAWPAGDVNQIPRGSDMTQRIDSSGLGNSLICRNDGVCWAVDANGWRHHIPTYGDNVCFRWVLGWRVSRNGLSYDQANSLPEANPWDCKFNNRIIATNEGAAYFVDTGNVRHWIQDPESFYCYADRGYPVIRGMGFSEANGIPEGGRMGQCLSPNRVLNRIVRVSDGTAYFIDGAGWWYWIPNGGVWGCLTSRYPILLSNASWDQVNTIRRERGVWANCNM
jgi:hypothetical protein